MNNSSVLPNIKEINFNIYSLIAREPKLSVLYYPFQLWVQFKCVQRGDNPQESFVAKNTEIAIDGFQGSANSFATKVFQKSQSKYVRVAHHMHSPAQTIKAIKYGIPVILVIRNPSDAILSLASRWSYISARAALKSYINFYSQLADYTDKVIISDFEQTTKHLDRVIDLINQKHKTNFDLPVIEKAGKKFKPPEAGAERKNRKKLKLEELNLPENKALLDRATEIYHQFVDLSTVSTEKMSRA